MQVETLRFSIPTLCCGSSGFLLWRCFHALVRVQRMGAVPLIGLELEGHAAVWRRSHVRISEHQEREARGAASWAQTASVEGSQMGRRAGGAQEPTRAPPGGWNC